MSQKGDLGKHVKTVHEKIKAFNCNSCEKSFGHRSDLNNHVKIVHQNFKNFRCDSCGKCFAQKSGLKGHLISVHKNRRDFSCDVCNKKFVSNSDMEKHIQKVHLKVKSKPTETERSMKIQQDEQNKNEIAKVEDPDTTVPKLEVNDIKTIVKFQLSEEYFTKEN